jgi:hypothetical protein
MGGDYPDIGQSITTDSLGNIYVTGEFQQNVNFRADFSGGTDSKTSFGSGDIFITKIVP